VLSVSSLFLRRVGVYVCVCVCIRTHTHTLHRWGLGCKPRSRDETPGGPEESSWTQSRHTYMRICVQSTHVYIYAKKRDETLDYLFFSFNMSFLLKSVEGVTTISKLQSLTLVRMKDCTLRVPNKTATLFVSEQ